MGLGERRGRAGRIVQAGNEYARGLLERPLVGRLECPYGNHLIAAVFDPEGILFPGSEDIHDPAPPGIFSVGIDEILLRVAEFSQNPDQAIPADGPSGLHFAKEPIQLLGPGDRQEKAGEIGYEKGWGQLLQPVQVAHPGRQGIERRLDLLVGIIEKRGEHERERLASHLGMIEPAFLAESEQRGCRRTDKYDGFIPFPGKSCQKIRLARGNEPGYPKPFFFFSQGIEKALELFRLIYEVEAHKTPIIQDEHAD